MFWLKAWIKRRLIIKFFDSTGMFYDAFMSLFFPLNCMACNGCLCPAETLLCTGCRFHLPQTNFHLQEENPMARSFWGKLPLEGASAFYFYQKGGAVQRLLHRLKYEGHQEIGLFLGELYGHVLLNAPVFKNVNYIIPVPLHPAKEKKRGFNQSTLFASGLSKSMGIPIDCYSLTRKRASQTQTRKNRYARWANVAEIFHLNVCTHLNQQHVLLVDDVVTTGATIEACAQVLLKVPALKISIASMAFA